MQLVLGICISFPKLGSAMNSYVSPALSKTFEERDPEGYLNVAGPIFIGLIFMGISLGLAVGIRFMI